jgi:outer membrane protein assembly factor BamB
MTLDSHTTVMRVCRLAIASAVSLGGCSSLAYAQPKTTAPDPIEGKWLGMTGFPQDRVPIGFEFKRNDHGEIKGYLYGPVSNFYGLDLGAPAERDGDKYVFRGQLLSLAFDGDSLTGTYFSLKAPITLHRTKKLPADVPLPKLPTGPGPRWRLALGGSIYARAAVRDGMAYVGTTGAILYAVSLNDGKIAWSFSAGRPIHGEALVTDDAVFFTCDNGFLYRLDRKTGKEVWRYELGDAQVPRVLGHPVTDDFDWDTKGPKPVLADSIVYVGSGDGSFHAVSVTDGKRIWRFETKGKVRSDALLDGPRVIFGSYDNHLYAVDRQSGKELWNVDMRGWVTSSPARVGDRIVVGSRSGLLAAFKPETGERIWRAVLWGSSVESDAVPYDSLFYIGSSDLRRASAISPNDGRVVWRTDVFGLPWGRPAVTEALVFIGASGFDPPYEIRHVGGLNAIDRQSGRIVWRWPMPAAPGSLMTGFAAGPVIDGETLVIGGLDGTLYAFPVR